MKPPAPHPDEPERLSAVDALGLLNPERDEAFDRVVRLAGQSLQVPISGFSVMGPTHQLFRACIGFAEHHQTSRDVSFCGHAILEPGLFEIPDATLDERFHDNPLVTGEPYIRFYAGIPVCTPDGLPVGALCVIDRVPRRLDDEQRRTLTDLRDILQNELALRTRIFRDHLTQLFNRRFLDDYLDRETLRAFRDNLPMAVMLLDIDHFKAYNDNLGHIAGDDALRRFGPMIEQACQRPGDICARYGGEEFAIVLPSTDTAGAERVYRRVRDALLAAPIAHPFGIGGVLTVSAGAIVADQREHFGGGPQLLIDGADQMLYSAKNAGRSRLEIAAFTLRRADADRALAGG